MANITITSDNELKHFNWISRHEHSTIEIEKATMAALTEMRMLLGNRERKKKEKKREKKLTKKKKQGRTDEENKSVSPVTTTNESNGN